MPGGADRGRACGWPIPCSATPTTPPSWVTPSTGRRRSPCRGSPPTSSRSSRTCGGSSTSATLRRIVVPTPIDWEPPSPATRLARRARPRRAVRPLRRATRCPFGRTRRAMRRFLREAVETQLGRRGRRRPGAARRRHRRRVPHAAVRRVVGAHRPAVGARAPPVVGPRVARRRAEQRHRALGFVAIMGPRNPMTLPDGFGTIDTVTEVDLWLPDRVRGERRLRRLWLSAGPDATTPAVTAGVVSATLGPRWGSVVSAAAATPRRLCRQGRSSVP